MALLKLAALSALGYVGYKYYESHKGDRAAFAGNQGGKDVRDAGPESMRDKPKREGRTTDAASDESFPASDPPSTY